MIGRTFLLKSSFVVSALLVSAGAFANDSVSSDDPGKPLVAQVCSGCHAEGIMGAPRIGDKSAWSPRFERDGGVEGLAEVAKHGRGNMPPRGGQPSLTDDQIKAAITYMLKQSNIL